MELFIFCPFILTTVVSVMAEIEMQFTSWPESVTTPVGDSVTFECRVRVPAERLAWRWRPLEPEGAPWEDLPGIMDHDRIYTKLVVELKQESQAGYYTCIAWYGAISLASVPARLAVPKVDLKGYKRETRLLEAPLRNTVILHCREPRSEPKAVLSWWREIGCEKKSLSAPLGVLVLSNVTTADSGAYGCSASNTLSGQTVELPGQILLKVQHENNGRIRFLEQESYVGKVDSEGVLTAEVLPNEALHIWCGIVGTPQPHVTWSRDNKPLPNRAKHDGMHLTLAPFMGEDEGIYSCSGGGMRRSWKVIALQPAHWTGSAVAVKQSEGKEARVNCGLPMGHPKPKVYWLLNAQPVDSDTAIMTSDSELHIGRVEKRHAGIVQCFACNALGCDYDAAMLTVVPVQISDQEYSEEVAKTMPPKKHSKKNPNKKKALLVPPTRPNVTRMSDDSVMVSWSNKNDGLPIRFFKVQYREMTNSSYSWNTGIEDIPAYIHSCQINGLVPDRYYKFRIAAVYTNDDNKLSKSSAKFFLQSGGFRAPRAPVLTKATALSPTSIMLNWTWSAGDGGVLAEGFYVYYRAIHSAGVYEKVIAPGAAQARSIVLTHLVPDIGYEFKLQAYTALAPSDFTSILTAKTLRSSNSTTTAAPEESTSRNDPQADGGGRALVGAGGAAGVALLVLLIAAIALCRRAHHTHRDKEKVSVPEGGGTNGYIPAKVPITITANPMHAESGDGAVEMSFLHNNNTGSEENTLPLQHSRKNGPAPRQYV